MRRLTSVTNEQWGALIPTSGGTRQIFVNANGGAVDPKDDTRAAFDQKPALDAYRWLRDRIWQGNVAMQRFQQQGSNSRSWRGGGWRPSWPARSTWPPGRARRPGPDHGVGRRAAAQGVGRKRNRVTVDGWSLWREGKSQPEGWGC